MKTQIIKTILCIFLLSLTITAQQRTGSLRGQVTDELGALVVGATVTLTAADGSQKTATTNAEGEQNGNNVIPTIVVQDAFIAGGSQVGLAHNNEDRWELQNYSTWTKGRCAVARRKQSDCP
jgi:hypothetical protein